MASTQQAAPPTPDVMSVTDVAKYLLVSSSTIRNLIRRKTIPVAKVGIQWRFRRSTIDAWMQRDTKTRCKALKS